MANPDGWKNFGGKPGPGRPKGSIDKRKAEFIELCRANAPKALQMMIDLASNAESEQVRLAATKELVDRGFGKAYVMRDPDIDPNDAANEANVLKVRIINDPEESPGGD